MPVRRMSKVSRQYHTLDEGLAVKPNANLAVITVPGEYAAREAQQSVWKPACMYSFSVITYPLMTK